MDETLRQAVRPAVAFLTAWLMDGDEYLPDAPASATLRYLGGLTDTEAEELFVGSIPLLTKGLLELLSQETRSAPLEVLDRLRADHPVRAEDG